MVRAMVSEHDPPGEVRCSFCGKPRDRVARMIAGPTLQVAICNECVELANEVLAEQRESEHPER